MERVFKSGVSVVVLAFTLPFITYWMPRSVVQALVVVVMGLGIISVVLLVPVYLFLYVVNSFKGR
jgi:hypothetical protein